MKHCRTLYLRVGEFLGARPSIGRARFVWAGGRWAGAPENFWARLGSGFEGISLKSHNFHGNHRLVKKLQKYRF